MADLVAYVDGGSLGNPGPSGIGVVLDGCEGRKIRIAKWIGRQDNNVAEYVALLEALQCALTLNARKLHVYSDSEVVVRQNERGIYLPQPAALFAELDLPQAGQVVRFLPSRTSGASTTRRANRLAQLGGSETHSLATFNRLTSTLGLNCS